MAGRPILPSPGPRFAAAAAGVFLGLLALWPLVHRPWAQAFRATARAVAAACGAAGRIAIVPERPEAAGGDTRVALLEPAGAQGVAFVVPSFNESYAPLAVLAALAAADRLCGRRQRRGRRTAAALAGVLAYVLLSWVVVVLRTAARAGSSLFEPGPIVRVAVELGYRVAVNPPAFEYVVPAVLWLACAAVWAGREGGARLDTVYAEH